MTTNLTRRLKEHNSGYNKSTKPYAPYKIIYTEHASNSIDARKTEKYLKGGKGKDWLKKHILGS